jgi:CBS domain-containing protein
MELRIEDVTVRKVVTVSPDVSVRAATDLMEEKSTSCLVMTSSGGVEGILTSRDVIQRVVARGLDPCAVTVGEIATRPVIVIKPEAFLSEAIKIMIQRKIKKIPLTSSDGKGDLVGLVSLSDIVELHSDVFTTLWEQIIMMDPVTIVEDEVCVTR